MQTHFQAPNVAYTVTKTSDVRRSSQRNGDYSDNDGVNSKSRALPFAHTLQIQKNVFSSETHVLGCILIQDVTRWNVPVRPFWTRFSPFPPIRSAYTYVNEWQSVCDKHKWSTRPAIDGAVCVDIANNSTHGSVIRSVRFMFSLSCLSSASTHSDSNYARNTIELWSLVQGTMTTPSHSRWHMCVNKVLWTNLIVLTGVRTCWRCENTDDIEFRYWCYVVASLGVAMTLIPNIYTYGMKFVSAGYSFVYGQCKNNPKTQSDSLYILEWSKHDKFWAYFLRALLYWFLL